MSAAALHEALQMSRNGDVEGAVRVLRDARAQGTATEAHLSLLFQLVTVRETPDEALEIASAALALAKLPIARSTWALRRGLMHLERAARAEALADLQLVLKLKATEEHATQAREALLRVAALPKKESAR